MLWCISLGRANAHPNSANQQNKNTNLISYAWGSTIVKTDYAEKRASSKKESKVSQKNFKISPSSLESGTLTAGDIAFIGFNADKDVSDRDHAFTWITLTEIPAGEVIYFTEQGWNEDDNTWMGNTEGHYQYTAPAAGLSCGTVVYVYEDGSTNDLVVMGGGTMTLVEGNGWNLSAGDQVLAYQAASVKGSGLTFISGIHADYNSGTYPDGTTPKYNSTTTWNTTVSGNTGVAESSLPPGLTNGVDCISLFPAPGPEFDNAKYIGTLTGDKNTLRALINDPSNWDSNDATPYDITPGQFSPSVDCSDAVNTAPTVTTTAISIFDATSATLGGNVTADGGAPVTERGVVYSSSDTDPKIGDIGVIKDDNGTGTGAFNESITGLTASTTYYTNAYAINAEGTSYGSVESFTTSAASGGGCSTDANTNTVNTNTANGDMGQSFVADCSGTLSAIELQWFSADPSFSIKVYNGAGTGGSQVGSTVSGLSSAGNGLNNFESFDVSPGGITLTSGNTYTIEVVGAENLFYDQSGGSVFSEGMLYFYGGAQSTLDVVFRVNIEAAPSNNAPVFNSSATASFAENTATSTVVLDVNADNGDGGADDAGVTYSLASGGDNDLFNINTSNGQITFKASPDYESAADGNTDNDYAITVTADDGEASGNTTDQNITITVTDVDEIAPSFENGRPSTANIAGSSFNLHIDMNEAGTVYYVVVSDGATAPTSAEVKAGTASGGGAVVTSDNQVLSSGGFTHSFNVSGLTSETAYDVYVSAEDDETTPNLQTTPIKLDINTSDITAPSFENGRPSAASIEGTSFNLLIDMNEAGTVYYVVVSDGATAPTSTEVKAGTASGGGAAVTSNSQVLSSGGFTHAFNVTGLSSATAYDVYVVAEDDEGTPNLQTTSTKLDVNTLAVPGLTIVESSASTVTAESGSTDEFTVVLDVQPASNVVVDISSSDTGEGTVDKTSLTFTNGNWNTPQTVIVTGIDDDIIDGAVTYNITLSIDDASSDDDYDGLSDQTISVNNSDDDVAGLTIVESSGSSATAEAGSTDDFTVVLNAQPSSDVVINISSSDTGEGTADKSSLTFTNSNWLTPQTITVTGVDDDIIDGTISYDITLSVADVSSDDDFDGISDQVSVDNGDDDVAGFTVTESDGSTSTSETGTTDDFTVVLDAEPSSDVVIDISSADTGEGTVDKSSFTFTPATWDTPQTVIVTGVDDAILDGSINYNITVAINAVSSDDDFDGVSSQTVSVTNQDDDQRKISVSDASVVEGDVTSSLQFTVTLNFAGSSTIEVDYATSDGSAKAGDDYTSKSGTLTFNAGETSKTADVTISGDTMVEEDEKLTFTLSGITGDAILGDDTATGTITDDDAASVTIADVSGNEDDGGITVTATLDHAVQGGFTVDVSTSDGTATAGDSDYTVVS
ncbi:MAG: Calx-beta domain-containing protein, partial [Cyclobacteriaceae bacterium]